MIGRLEGTVLLKNPPQILVDVQGVGYEIDVPMSTFYQLPETGMTVALLTHLAVREDGFFLYGFSTEAERHAFRQLIKIGGVGARTALAVLSGLSVDDLAAVVARQEGGRLTKIPGIGKKTAERLLFELKGKLPESQQSRLPPSNGIDDVVNALLALGYNAREAAAAVETLPEGISTADGIRSALKQLAKI